MELGGERLRGGETENQRNLETLAEKRKQREEIQSWRQRCRDGGQGPKTEVEKCSTDVQMPRMSDGHHTGKTPSAAHKSGARTASHRVVPGTKAWDLLS